MQLARFLNWVLRFDGLQVEQKNASYRTQRRLNTDNKYY